MLSQVVAASIMFTFMSLNFVKTAMLYISFQQGKCIYEIVSAEDAGA